MVMKNIIEAGKYIQRERLIKLVADMKVYTIRNQVSIVGQSVFSFFHAIIGVVAKMMGKEWKEYKVAKWQDRHSDVCWEIERGELGRLDEVVESTLKRKLSIPGRYSKNMEMLSTYIVNLAAKGFERGGMDGLSIPEKVEYIFEKYPHMKEKNEKKILFIWFILACLMLILFGIGILSFEQNEYWMHMILVMLVLFTGIQISFGIYIIRKIKVRWAMHFVWLARSEYGQKLVDAKLALLAIGEKEKIEAKEDLQLLQSYLWFTNNESQKIAQNHYGIIEAERKIKRNENRILELQDKQDQDTTSMRNNLREENEMLKKHIATFQAKTKQSEKIIQDYQQKLEEENKNASMFYTELWNRYRKIVFDENACIHILQNLCFEDLSKMENRLYELNHVSDPMALAEHKNGKDFLSFRTEQNCIARIYFYYDTKKDIVHIVSFERDESLVIEPLTPEAIESILKRRGKTISSESILAYREQIEKLNAYASQLKEEKVSADIKLQNSIKEISQLNTRIYENTKRCKELEEELQRVSDDKERAERILREYEQKQEENMRLLEEAARAKQELNQWKQECDRLSAEIIQNNEESVRIKQDLETQIKVLDSQIVSLQSAYDLQESILKESRVNTAADKSTIKKLEDINRDLGNTLARTKKEKEDTKAQIDWLEKKYQKDEKRLQEQIKLAEQAKEEARQAVLKMQEAGKDVSVEMFNNIYNKIKKRFPKLTAVEMKMFTTAEQIFMVFGNHEKLDYAPVVVEYSRLLEVILWRYLEKSMEYQPERNDCISRGKGKTLGSATTIISKDVGKPLGKYAEELKKIKEIRNEAAHKGTQGFKHVEQIKNFIWNTDILTKVTSR